MFHLYTSYISYNEYLIFVLHRHHYTSEAFKLRKRNPKLIAQSAIDLHDDVKLLLNLFTQI
jgi:hypothetical protein